MNAPALPTADLADRTDPVDPSVLDDPLELDRFSRWIDRPDGRREAESALQVSGMTCAACAGLIEAAVARVDGVRSVRVSAASQRASVRWDPQRTRPSALIAAIRAAGYDAVPDAAAPARELRRAEQRRALWRLFVAAFCMMQVMMLATPSYIAHGDELAPDLRQLLNWGQWVLTLPVVAFAAGPFFRGAWRALRLRAIGMDVPVALGIGVAFVASTGASFAPGGLFGHEVYFDSLTMFVSFLLGARLLEMRARHRANAALEASLAAMPPTALREGADGALERVSVMRLRPGDTVRVPAGEAFPADGRLLQGRTQADEALLSGESTPVPKAPGDGLVAGSLNLGAPVRLRVERVGADTRFEAIVAMMRSALTQRPAAARLADRWAAPFLWVVMLLAAGSAAVWSVIDPSQAVAVAVAVLIVTCPCALSLAAPATLVATAGGLARRGVLLQRLDAIEPLARLQHLFVDKTGTLTDDRLQVVALRLAPRAPLDAATVRRHAAGLAMWSAHPVAVAVATALDAADGAAATLTDVEEAPGQGLQGRDALGRRWQLGAAAELAPQADWAAGARSVLACDGKPVAAVVLEESLRPGAAAAMAALQADGVALTLLSGDAPARVHALAARIGVADAQGAASPADKLAAVQRAQDQGRCVGMVGDGLNDGPVLARADVSLAMGHGALVSRAQADAVVMSGDWADIVRARATAQRALRIVRQNMAWAALYNAACIPLAMVGWLPPWAAGLGMAASSLLVIGNALRAGR